MEQGKLEKYQSLREELKKECRVKAAVVLVVNGPLGAVSGSSRSQETDRQIDMKLTFTLHREYCRFVCIVLFIYFVISKKKVYYFPKCV